VCLNRVAAVCYVFPTDVSPNPRSSHFEEEQPSVAAVPGQQLLQLRELPRVPSRKQRPRRRCRQLGGRHRRAGRARDDAGGGAAAARGGGVQRGGLQAQQALGGEQGDMLQVGQVPNHCRVCVCGGGGVG
jgi:hypothetical protein